MIPVRSNVGHEMRMHSERLVNGYGRKQLIFVYIEDNMFTFHLGKKSEIHRHRYCEHFSAARKRVWQSSALASPTKTLNTDLAPIGGDSEPTEALREDVEMGNDEDEELLEAKVPTANMNLKNPTSREQQEHEDSGHAVYRHGCAACVEGRRAGGHHRTDPMEDEERENYHSRCCF